LRLLQINEGLSKTASAGIAQRRDQDQFSAYGWRDIRVRRALCAGPENRPGRLQRPTPACAQCPPALITRKLAAYPRQNQIARALNEIGQLEKTVFILELLLDPQLRRRQERGLNDGEAVNSASRAIFVGQRGEFRDRAYQDQVHRASCLHLLVAAIAAWTTPYLADAIETLRAEGEDVPDELIAHLSPVAWEPANFLGRYTFDPANARSLDDRRPFRSGADETEEAA
jgi:Tn3 transposase DDE domain